MVISAKVLTWTKAKHYCKLASGFEAYKIAK